MTFLRFLTVENSIFNLKPAENVPFIQKMVKKMKFNTNNISKTV